MPLSEQTNLALQSALIDFAEQFAKLQREHNLTGLSMHLAPDSCWISQEHDVDTELDEMTECKITLISRRPPSCHEIITKI